MPQSKESPAATVCTALMAEEPEEAGREPPEVPEPLLRLAEAVTAAANDAALLEPRAKADEEVVLTTLLYP